MTEKYPHTITLSDEITLHRDTDHDEFLHEAEWKTHTAVDDLLMVVRAKDWTACSANERARPWLIGVWWKHKDGTNSPSDFLQRRYRTRNEAVSALAARYQSEYPGMF